MGLVKIRKAKKPAYIYFRGRRRRVDVGQRLGLSGRAVNHDDDRSTSTTTGQLNSSISSMPMMDTVPMEGDEQAQGDTKTSSSKDYGVRKEKRLAEWEKIRIGCLSEAVQLDAPPERCVKCNVNIIEGMDFFRCMDCCQWESLCRSCILTRHSSPHLHIFEIWKNLAYVLHETESPPFRVLDNKETIMKAVILVDSKGRQHKRQVEYPIDKSEAETLIRLGFWPSTPNHPRMAFHMDLMNMAHAFMVEGHLSLKSFTESLKALHPKHIQHLVSVQIKDIYKILVTESFEEFRWFRYKLDNNFFDDGTECPACFQNSIQIYSMDADFQLVRKHSSGKKWKDPYHNDHFFLNQDQVDEFMNNYLKQSEKPDVNCNEFQAGSTLRSKNKNTKLDETAVFGSVCRHEYPYRFFSLKHGERLGYGVYLIRRLLEEKPKKTILLYDIACSLDSHLKKHPDPIIGVNDVTMAIPIFHSYGHKMRCQILYGPRRVEGIGLTDGEATERLWSYLGQFSNITKECSPEKRTDILEDGLIHYGAKLRDKLGISLPKKMEKAMNIFMSSQKSLQELLKSSEATTIQDIDNWIEEERKDSKPTSSEQQISDLTPEEEYCLDVDKLQKLRQIENPDGKKIQSLSKRVLKMKKKMKEINFETTLSTAKEKTRVSLMKDLKKLLYERLFLLDLIKRYSRGQAIAIRLSRNLKNLNKKIKNQINIYNSYVSDENQSESFNSLKDKIFENCDVTSPSVKKEMTFMRLLELRSNEEIRLVKEEMKSTIHFYRNQHKEILNYYTSLHGGLKSCIVKEGLYVETILCKLIKRFENYIGNVSVESYFHELLDMNLMSDSVNDNDNGYEDGNDDDDDVNDDDDDDEEEDDEVDEKNDDDKD